ncbi:MAG: trypsin-like peptidase domain-containing protein [Bacteroidota bacterium]|nr:trypsin-like peptidase domain-containing protein [Bacteroidota bacterium]
MKPILNFLSISIFSCILTLFIYINYFQIDEKINSIEKPQLIPASYSYNKSTSQLQATDFTNAAEKTINAVVHVKNTSTQDDEYSWFYRNFYGIDSDREKIGTGSGVIVSPDGYIITNFHVVEDANEIEVTSNRNKSYKATLVGLDPNTDLAVLKINDDSPFPYIPFGNSDNSKTGEWVLAVGNPFNLNSTVTAGIISAKSRDLNDYDQKNQSFIQTDAAVNMGNSGGALVNTYGELIGINTAIQSITGGFVGYAFAVPSNIVRKVFEDILEYGDVQKGLLGVTGNALNDELAKRYETNQTEGFYINSTEKNLGADRAGLIAGDIIKQVDNVKINKFSDLTGYLSSKRPGDKVVVVYIRNSNKYTTTVTLRKTNRTLFLGMELRNKTKDDRNYFDKLDINYGVVISRIENRRLYNLGIEEGYLILEINDQKIDEVGQIENIPLKSISSILFLDKNGQKERILFE